DGARQRDFAFINAHLDIRRVQTPMACQTLVYILADALVRTLVALWPAPGLGTVFHPRFHLAHAAFAAVARLAPHTFALGPIPALAHVAFAAIAGIALAAPATFTAVTALTAIAAHTTFAAPVTLVAITAHTAFSAIIALRAKAAHAA